MKSCYWFLDFFEDWPHDMLGSSPYLAVNCKLAFIRCIWCWCWSMSWQDDRCEVWVFCRLADLPSLWISQSMKKTSHWSELDSSHRRSFVLGRQAVAASVVSVIIDDHWEYLLQDAHDTYASQPTSCGTSHTSHMELCRCVGLVLQSQIQLWGSGLQQ